MTKYDIELKLKLIQEMIETKRGPKYIGRKYGIRPSSIDYWNRLYQLYGVEGLKIKHKSYSGEFKETVLEYMKQNHLSLTETGLHFRITSLSTIIQWKRRFDQEGRSSLYEERRGRHLKMIPKKKKVVKPPNPNSIEALLEENEQLRMENAYLKKLRALVRKRLDQESGKKSKS